MNCPICGTKHTQVVETRKAKYGIYRRRECFNGHKFTTKEVATNAKQSR